MGVFKKISFTKFKHPTFQICVSLFFILYWIILSPLIYVALHKHYKKYEVGIWSDNFPVYYWVIALLIFLAIILLFYLYWSILDDNDKIFELIKETGQLKCNHDKNLCYLTINEREKSIDSFVIKDVELRKNEKVNDNRRHTEVARREKPKLEIKLRPLSQPLESVLTPLTPREVFFMDMIDAANKSPAASIPETQVFLENERRFSDKEYDYPELEKHKLNVVDVKYKEHFVSQNDNEIKVENQIFIATVPKKFSESNVVFMYIPDDDNCEQKNEQNDEQFQEVFTE